LSLRRRFCIRNRGEACITRVHAGIGSLRWIEIREVRRRQRAAARYIVDPVGVARIVLYSAKGEYSGVLLDNVSGNDGH
jgi:hypothetical protein